MHRLSLRPSALGFVVSTRALLAFGAGLLVAEHIPAVKRRALALSLIGFGVATTIPAARMVFQGREQTWESRANRDLIDVGMGRREAIGLKRAI